jgi:predicted lysophospholipase L1 biosynthesis ABC-type transport system permease subunit
VILTIALAFAVVFFGGLTVTGVLVTWRGRHWLQQPEMARARLARRYAAQGLNFDAVVSDQNALHRTLQQRGRFLLVFGVVLVILGLAGLGGSAVFGQWIRGVSADIEQTSAELDGYSASPHAEGL